MPHKKNQREVSVAKLAVVKSLRNGESLRHLERERKREREREKGRGFHRVQIKN